MMQKRSRSPHKKSNLICSRREAFAWITVLVQFVMLVAVLSLRTSDEQPSQQTGPQDQNFFRRRSDIEAVPATRNTADLKSEWRGAKEPNLQGSCWCSGTDNYCMCTPSLAIDLVLTSGPEHLWLVKRKDTGQYATMGGFVEVGESAEAAVARELKEETGLDLKTDLVLFGFYSDPMRDKRRHTASVVYIVNIPLGDIPKAADDVKEVQRFHVSDIDSLDLFADHKTILSDYISGSDEIKAAMQLSRKKTFVVKDPIARTVCRSISHQ